MPAPKTEGEAARGAPIVAVEPAARLPAAEVEGDTGRGLTVLTAPRDREAARSVASRFFRAVLEESIEGLAAVLDERCTIRVDLAGNRTMCRSLWPVRFDRLDYGALVGKLVYRERDIETFEDVPALARVGRALPIAASAGEVVARVPIAATRSGKERLFGDEIWFVLKPSANGYTISEMMEEFSLP